MLANIFYRLQKLFKKKNLFFNYYYFLLGYNFNKSNNNYNFVDLDNIIPFYLDFIFLTIFIITFLSSFLIKFLFYTQEEPFLSYYKASVYYWKTLYIKPTPYFSHIKFFESYINETSIKLHIWFNDLFYPFWRHEQSYMLPQWFHYIHWPNILAKLEICSFLRMGYYCVYIHNLFLSLLLRYTYIRIIIFLFYLLLRELFLNSCLYKNFFYPFWKDHKERFLIILAQNKTLRIYYYFLILLKELRLWLIYIPFKFCIKKPYKKYVAHLIEPNFIYIISYVFSVSGRLLKPDAIFFFICFFAWIEVSSLIEIWQEISVFHFIYWIFAFAYKHYKTTVCIILFNICHLIELTSISDFFYIKRKFPQYWWHKADIKVIHNYCSYKKILFQENINLLHQLRLNSITVNWNKNLKDENFISQTFFETTWQSLLITFILLFFSFYVYFNL